jgi:stress-induced-phosphoprotein 1
MFIASRNANRYLLLMLIRNCYIYSDQGLEKEPTNTALKSGLESVKKAMDSNSPFGAGENPMASMFSDPNLIGKLASNPRTSKFMADPSFVQKIRDLQSGKANADMANILQDQRMLAVLGVAMGVDMVSRYVKVSRSEGLD